MSHLLSDSKLSENRATGDAAYKKAKKYTEKTLTRWKADWEQAARFYREATKAYRLAGPSAERLLLSSLRESAVAHDNNNDFHTAGSEGEAAAGVALKLGEADLSFDLYKEASVYYRKHNSFSKGTTMLVKAAEAMETVDLSRAVGVLLEACQLYFEDESQTMFHDLTFKKTINFLVKHQRYAQAIQAMQQQITICRRKMETFSGELNKNVLQIIVLLFFEKKYEEAKKVLEEFEFSDQFGMSNECRAAQELLDAYDVGDNEKLATSIKLSPFKFIANSIGVLARKIHFDRDVELAGKQRKLNRQNMVDLEDSEEDEKGKSAADRFAEDEEEQTRKELEQLEIQNKKKKTKPKAKSAAASAATTISSEEDEEQQTTAETVEEEPAEKEAPKPKPKKKTRKVAKPEVDTADEPEEQEHNSVSDVSEDVEEVKKPVKKNKKKPVASTVEEEDEAEIRRNPREVGSGEEEPEQEQNTTKKVKKKSGKKLKKKEEEETGDGIGDGVGAGGTARPTKTEEDEEANQAVSSPSQDALSEDDVKPRSKGKLKKKASKLTKTEDLDLC